MVTENCQHSFDQKPLDVNDILVGEFNCVAKTAFLANEDRARVFNHFLMTVGAAVAAILGPRMLNEV